MSKILVIEDQNKFVSQLLTISSKGFNTHLPGFNQLLTGEYELKDVIEFKAEAIEYEPPSEGCFRLEVEGELHGSMKLPKDKFRLGDKLQVFAIKKAEGKDEGKKENL